MKIVRGFWGKIDTHINDIKYCTQYKLNEVVYVWGSENHKIISELGYETVLVNAEPYDPAIGSEYHYFLKHKLVVVDTATKKYGEILFLDWDCFIVKELDQWFYESLITGHPLRVPLYLYTEQSLLLMMHNTKDTPGEYIMKKFAEDVPSYSYKFNDNYVIPNAGFIYCRSQNISEQLVEYVDKFKLQSLVDEFAIYCYTRDQGYTLDDYIEKIEPNVISAIRRYEDWWVEAQNKLIAYCETKIEKRIYIEHI